MKGKSHLNVNLVNVVVIMKTTCNNMLLQSMKGRNHSDVKGSILGPRLFLVMVADLPQFVTCGFSNAKMTSFADDSTVHVHSKSLSTLKSDLERVSARMISYCQGTGLVINSGKTQLLVSTKEKLLQTRLFRK